MAELTDLTKEFNYLITSGDEAAARDFLVDRFQEFPEDIQNKITFAFYSEAVVNQADEENAIPETQKEGLDALSILLAAKDELENIQRIGQLKDGLSQPKS